MRPRIISLACLMLAATMMVAQGIKRHQYWIDSDYSGQKTVTSDNTTFSLIVSVASLTPGIHFLNYRALNSDDEWGTLSRTLFYIPANMSADAAVKSCEYWIDAEYANRKSENGGNSLAATVDVSELSAGIHFFNYRAVDNFGQAGTLSRTLFYIPANMSADAAVKSCEYWIDAEYANRKSENGGNSLAATVDVSKLSAGIHFFNYRAVSNLGETGTLSRTLFYIPERVSEDVKIAEYEYWIDDNVADRVTGKDAKDVYMLTKDVSALADGDHTFTFRAKNTDGVWGTLYTEAFAIDGSIAETLIDFADTGTESVCVANWDTDGDGYLSKTEAAAVTTLGTVFRDNEEMTSFEELQYFTSLTELDADAFRNCTKLETLTLPDGLTEIGNNAFTNCPSLQSLHIPASLTTIGEESVFHYCTSLTAFTVDAASTSFCAEDGILYNKDKTELICCPAAKAGVLTLPSTVQAIRTSAFAMCTELTTLKLPASLTKIGDAAFVGCSGLQYIDFSAESQLSEIGIGCTNGCSSLKGFRVGTSIRGTIGQNYEVYNSVLFDIRGGSRILLSYPNAYGTIYTIPVGVTDVMDYAFTLTNIKEVTLPASLKGLHANAFAYCEKLAKVTSLAWQPCDATDAFAGSAANATLYVRKGTKDAYEKAAGWDGFKEIVEFISYDVNEDGQVNNDDVQVIVNYIMGKASTGFAWQKADVTGDGEVNAADVVELLKIIRKHLDNMEAPDVGLDIDPDSTEEVF